MNSDDPSSVKQFYFDVFLLSGELFILNDRVGYKVAFKTTAELNDGLKLAKIRTVCGDDCNALLLSQIHWFIRNYANTLLSDFESSAMQYLK